MDPSDWNEFGRRYAEAWCSQDGDRVAALYAEGGSLSVNDGTPAVGRAAIAQVARGFMTDFPDVTVTMDEIEPQLKGGAIFRWTLTGTNTGSGGKGKRVRMRGFEEWRLSPDGFIAESKGHFDAMDYQRQLEHGDGNPTLNDP